jgi:hypothetical protein
MGIDGKGAYMRRSPLVRAALVWTAIAVAMACSRQDTLTPEAASAKGDDLLRRMSQAVAATQAFSYTAEQTRERVRRNGEKVEEKFTRRVTVRRPNALAFADEGVGHDTKAWYDGKFVTLVSDSQKAWARGPMPATLDEAMDFVSAEYAIQIPTADLLYSSPYDALMTKDTKGGWVGEEKVGDTACDHLSYQQAVVDWEIWLTQDRTLPKKVRIKYKTQAGQPVTTVVFGNWNASPQVSDETFAAKIPDGYERLKIMRYATVEAKPAADAAPK